MTLTDGLWNEGYKWKVVAAFEKHWDINAEDFSAMLRESLKQHVNLLYRNSYDFISKCALNFPEEVRAIFALLFDESRPVDERMRHFHESCEQLLPRLKAALNKEGIGAYQDERACGAYLAFRYPRKYMLFKVSYYDAMCDFYGIKPAAMWHRVGDIARMAEHIRQVMLAEFPEVIRTMGELLDKYDLKEDGLNMIVQDACIRILEWKQDQGAKHWLFQSNPTRYDLAGALRAGALSTWQINQHKKDIHPGDRVVLFQSGELSGFYALATVMSEVAQIEEGEDEQLFWKDEDTGKPVERVELRIDRAFPDSPILKDSVLSNPTLKDAPIGRQGTNFALTAEQFSAFETLAPAVNDRPRFWLYSPGPGAEQWTEFHEKGIMALGWAEMGNLDIHKSREDIRDAFVKLYSPKNNPRNDTLALWEFVHELQPGDIVITKRGRSEYLGYGYVEGAYTYDASLGEYPHVRKVRWVKQGSWAGDFKLVIKTLTDITKYPNYVAKLKNLIGIEGGAPMPSTRTASPAGARNVILYGPPGTGKTYALRRDYMPRFTDRVDNQTMDQRAVNLVRDRAWWEVIAVALLDLGGRSTVSGILAHPLLEARIGMASNRSPRSMIWAALQSHTIVECETVKYATRTDPLVFSKDTDSFWSIDSALTKRDAPELIDLFNAYRQPASGPSEIKRYRFTTFHQSFSYEDFIEGIKPQMEDQDDGQIAYEIRPGVFKEIAAEAVANPDKEYALFIDEINRGNIASIFGELITLIELDKRLGAENELQSVLPYSKKTFGVPRNLWIVGTMNTADRSVEALDTALRRRFVFIEMRPDASLVAKHQPEGLTVDLARLMEAINARIERLLDHDHAVGHSFFLKIKDLATLKLVFKNEIMPLLREFFYGNPAKIGLILGERFVTKKSGVAAFKQGDWGAEDVDEKEVFAFVDPETLKEEDFVSIYA